MATIFDSLPYYDNDLDLYPNLREKVEKELAREGKNPQSLHPNVPPPIELFTASHLNQIVQQVDNVYITQKNPLLAAELARIESRQPLTPLDTTRHQLPGPTSVPGTDEDWQTALKNAYAQLEHQRIRSVLRHLLLRC
jgi:pre-mRNA-splicing factor SPF27